jgi:hypothetical protein
VCSTRSSTIEKLYDMSNRSIIKQNFQNTFSNPKSIMEFDSLFTSTETLYSSLSTSLTQLYTLASESSPVLLNLTSNLNSTLQLFGNSLPSLASYTNSALLFIYNSAIVGDTLFEQVQSFVILLAVLFLSFMYV